MSIARWHEDVAEMFGRDRSIAEDLPLWQRLLLVPICLALHVLGWLTDKIVGGAR